MTAKAIAERLTYGVSTTGQIEKEIIEYTKAKCKEQRLKCAVAYIMTHGRM